LVIIPIDTPLVVDRWNNSGSALKSDRFLFWQWHKRKAPEGDRGFVVQNKGVIGVVCNITYFNSLSRAFFKTGKQ
jgi:hypothetical protein